MKITSFYILVTILFIVNNEGISQVEQPIYPRENEQEFRNAAGVACKPFGSIVQRLDSLSLAIFCQDSVRCYFLNGMALTESTFVQENLNKVVNGEGWYDFQFQNNDTSQCIKTLRFFLTINVPVILNGIKLQDSEVTNKIKIIKQDQIVSIKKRKTWFWGSTYLEITTKE